MELLRRPFSIRMERLRWAGALCFFALAVFLIFSSCSRPKYIAYRTPEPGMLKTETVEKSLNLQTRSEVEKQNRNCVKCHKDAFDPHQRDPESPPSFAMACVDCHGGNPAGLTEEEAHPAPRFTQVWTSAANPKRTETQLLKENWDWIRFVNPGDLRVANVTCGACHAGEVLSVLKSLMTTSAHFWGTAGYCNGILSAKRTAFGESYSPDGTPQRVNTVWQDPSAREEDEKHGVIESIVPLPHWEVTQPGNIYRVFEKGSRLGHVALGINGLPVPVVGLPDKLEDPGRPNNRLSDRGMGTLNRVDLPILNLQKTRLNDPFLHFLGSNDHAGDYRSSGCTACHVVYANDRSPVHSGPYAKYGHTGRSFGADPTIKKDESGHPIQHRFTSRIPSSQCMTCHHHQPNSFLNSYFGFTMWTYETDGELMWPKKQKHPSNSELVNGLMFNPEEASVRGNWGDPEFLKNVSDLNPRLKHTQFADYHGHGWIFRAVFKMDKKGNLLDRDGHQISYSDPNKFKGVVPLTEGAGPDAKPNDAKPNDAKSNDAKALAPPFSAVDESAGRAVHLKDIHAEKGMHCVDCHFSQDVHGNQKLYAEYQAAIEIACKDCHGTTSGYAKLVPSGPASHTGKTGDFTRALTPSGKQRFEVIDDVIYQNSMLHDNLRWRVPQVKDSVDPNSEHYNPRSDYAKTVRKDNKAWGALPGSEEEFAHRESRMTCQSCHSSWVTSCFGCHLPQKANMRTPMRHFESRNLRNYASYNPQVARDDALMLGISPDVQDNKISTVRSSSGIVISSEDGLRQKIYTQIGTTAANGMSGQAFNTHFAHTVRTTETRSCEDCHVSEKNDNNAWLAQTYLLGTNFVNFVGYHAYIGAASGGLYAVRATEWEEPQAVIGSYLHKLAYPDWYAKFVEGGRILDEAVHHSGNVLNLQLRGEYLYSACGSGGFRVYDVANVANKGFSEKIVTSPVSPLGQDTHIATSFATAVALPTNNPISMSRVYREENREQKYVYEGKAQTLHELYRYAYVTDSEEGLIVVDVDCLTDGDPQNNFIERVATFNPEGALEGAVNLAVAGSTVYVCARGGVYAISIDDPRAPRIIAHAGEPHLTSPLAIAIQFRYAFVCDADGVKVLDVTLPEEMAPVEGAVVKLPQAKGIYVARTYGYVAAGSEGLVILDLGKPAEPKVERTWNDGGKINDLHQIKVGMTNDTVFAYLADGKNGLRIVQLVSPEDTEETQRSAYGFSPRPLPKLIATFPTSTPTVAISKGLDRDRAVDESGNQMAVFGRIGGRPFNLEEMRRLYLNDGKVYPVSNEPQTSRTER